MCVICATVRMNNKYTCICMHACRCIYATNATTLGQSCGADRDASKFFITDARRLLAISLCSLCHLTRAHRVIATRRSARRRTASGFQTFSPSKSLH